MANHDHIAAMPRMEPWAAPAVRTAHPEGKLAKLVSELERLKIIEQEMLASPNQQISLTDPDFGRWRRVSAAEHDRC
jgi:hypothetical protein